MGKQSKMILGIAGAVLAVGLVFLYCLRDERVPADQEEETRIEEKIPAEDAADCETEEPAEIYADEVEEEQEKSYDIEEYGEIQESRQDFFDEDTGEIFYYYEMEKFFFQDSFPNAALINQTLQHIYDGYEENYREGAEAYRGDGESLNTPYEYWHILSLSYVGEDYVSILYNDVSYMGGAHPYSWFDGIVIDCKTGEEVSLPQLLGRSDEDILTEVSDKMGLDVTGTWEDIDFYFTDSAVVFFYCEPGFWEDVVLDRNVH